MDCHVDSRLAMTTYYYCEQFCLYPYSSVAGGNPELLMVNAKPADKLLSQFALADANPDHPVHSHIVQSACA